MKKQRRSILEDCRCPASVDGGEFTGASAFFDQPFENLANLFTPLRGSIGPHLDDATVGFEEGSVFEKLLFAPTMKLEHDGLDSRSGRNRTQCDLLNKDFQFAEPLIDDGIENLRFITEKTIHIAVRHAQCASDIDNGHFIMPVTPQKRLCGFDNFSSGINWTVRAHAGYLPRELPFDKPLNYRLHFLKLVRG